MYTVVIISQMIMLSVVRICKITRIDLMCFYYIKQKTMSDDGYVISGDRIVDYFDCGNHFTVLA